MFGGTLIVSRAAALFPLYKKYLEDLGFYNVRTTAEEKEKLIKVINDLKPYIIFVEACFYEMATPYMMGRLLRVMPHLNIAAFSIGAYPADMAAWFFFHKLKGYLDLREGLEIFCRGLQRLKAGEVSFSPNVQALIDDYAEWPDTGLDITNRQMEVLIAVCNGFATLDIAANLNIGKRTVEWHVNDLYQTFHVRNKEELIRVAVYLDIVTKDDMRFFRGRREPVELPQWAKVKQALTRSNYHDDTD
jgi:DNA-binding NarL/FixJ family response regulator